MIHIHNLAQENSWHTRMMKTIEILTVENPIHIQRRLTVRRRIVDPRLNFLKLFCDWFKLGHVALLLVYHWIISPPSLYFSPGSTIVWCTVRQSFNHRKMAEEMFSNKFFGGQERTRSPIHWSEHQWALQRGPAAFSEVKSLSLYYVIHMSESVSRKF
jgi:hypothetical protein